VAEEVIPKFRLVAVGKLRKKIYSDVFADRCGSVVDSEALVEMTRSLLKITAGIHRDAAYETLRVFLGERLLQPVAVDMTWRIAGNMSKLIGGVAVRGWAGQTEVEWMPVQIISIQQARPFKDVTNECQFKVLAGSACPTVVTRYLSRPALKYIARKVGFSSPWNSYPYHFVEELIGLRCVAKFTPELVRNGHPGFREIACPSSIMKWNRDTYLAVRCRKKKECPQKFTHPCAHCAFGLDRCQYAVHPKTYELGLCPECNNADAVFDPASRSSVCVKCTTAQRLRRG
jgi:hypothetical protein